MKFLLIFGDGAVGKMTVGQELVKTTKFKLFHNHMSIEPVLEIFGDYNKQVVHDFRQSVFENFAKTDNYGLIFTFIWAFDQKEDWDAVENISNIFKDNRLLSHDKKYRLVSNDGEVPYENYIKIDNTHLSPEETAKIIKEKFNF